MLRSLREKSPNVLINQFPFENVVNVKDLLAVVCRRVPDSSKWLPITYNLTYEIVKFIKYFKQREEEGLDNHWILKPWNLARSIDMVVTNNLNQIIRYQETGPKVKNANNYFSSLILLNDFIFIDRLQIYNKSGFVLSRRAKRKSEIRRSIYSPVEKH